jgi:hypothetical protein
MTMSRFRASPRQGHMDRVKRIHGYISKMKHGIVRIRTEEPDHSDIPEIPYDWEHHVAEEPKKRLTPRHQGPVRELSSRPMLMLTYSMILSVENQLLVPYIGPTRRLSSLPSYSPPSRLPHSDPNMLLPGPPLNRSLISGAPSDTRSTCCPLYCYVW